jgi:hypothetical protein
LFLTSPALWTGFALFQQDKGKRGSHPLKNRKLAGICQVIAVLRLSPKMKIASMHLQHELKQTHGNRIGS